MKLQNSIQKRRSIRKFKDKKVDYRDIFDCLDTTRFAPMAGGYFSLKFLLTDEKDKIKEVAEITEQEFIQEAKYLVIFMSDPKITKNLYKDRAEIYLHQQAGAAIQNFLLSLTEKGLGTCWIGHFNEDRLKRIFKIPAGQIVEAVFPIGYEKEKPKTREVMAELYNRMNFNQYGNKRMKKTTVQEAFPRVMYRGENL